MTVTTIIEAQARPNSRRRSFFSGSPREEGSQRDAGSDRRRRSRRHRDRPERNPLAAQVFGYHNIFHTHAQPDLDARPPPSYDIATDPVEQRKRRPLQYQHPSKDQLPGYTCTVSRTGVVGLKNELSSPFRHARDRKWQDVVAELNGTQLCLHQMKTPNFLQRYNSAGKDLPFWMGRPVQEGRLIKQFTLQHAEVGVAVDFQKTSLIPRSALAKLIPVHSREKVYETDPHLFEPVREFVLRLRVEAEQILLCFETQDEMLDWVEQLCAAIDISHPIEDRSEPRYRSLPRRNRRQRLIESLGTGQENQINDRRIIAEQERIFQTMYPQLAASRSNADSEGSTDATPQEPVSPTDPVDSGDPDAEDLDRADVLIPSNNASGHRRDDSTVSLRPFSSDSANRSTVVTPTTRNTPFNPKTAIRPEPRPETLLRYRRRCAPILLYHSSRASEIVIVHGERVRLDSRKPQYLPYVELPPRYESHKFPPAPKAEPSEEEHVESSDILEVIGEQTTAEPSEGDAISSNDNSDSGATAVATPATTAPPSLHHGNSEEDLSIQPISEAATRVGSCDSAITETPPETRQIRHRASSAELLTGMWRGRLFGSQKVKGHRSEDASGQQQNTGSRPRNERKISDLNAKFSPEESAEVERSLSRMGLLL